MAKYYNSARTAAQLDLVRRRPHHDVALVVHNDALPRPPKQVSELAHARHRILRAQTLNQRGSSQAAA